MGDLWIHQICGLLCDQYQVIDFATMEFSQVSSSSETSSPQTTEDGDGCFYCAKSSGFLISCLKRNCKHRVHPFCIFEELREASLKSAVTEETTDEDTEMSNTSSQEAAEEESLVGWELELKL